MFINNSALFTSNSTLFTCKTSSIAIVLLLTISLLLTNNQSHAMLRLANRVKPTAPFSAGVRNMSLATKLSHKPIIKGRHFFLAGIATTAGALYGVNSLLNDMPTDDTPIGTYIYSGLKRAYYANSLSMVRQFPTGESRATKTIASKDSGSGQQRTIDTGKEKQQKVHISDAQSCRKIVSKIIESEKNPDNFITDSGETLLIVASKYNAVDAIKELLEYKAALASRAQKEEENKEKTELATLHLYDKNKYQEFMQTVTKAGMNPNEFVDKHGKTPLMAACEFGDLDAVKMLLEKGGKSIVKDRLHGLNALSFAIMQDHIGVVRFLLEHPDLELETDRLYVPYPPYTSGRPNTPSRQLFKEYCDKKAAEYNENQAKMRKKEAAEKEALRQKRLSDFCAQQPK